MKRFRNVLALAMVLGWSSTALGQVFFVHLGGGLQIIRTDFDGSNWTVIHTSDDTAISNVILATFPNATSIQSIGGDEVTIDSPAQQIYWVANFFEGGNSLAAIMRSNLDGSNIEFVTSGAASFNGIQIHHPSGSVPAIGARGMGIMALMLVGVAMVLFWSPTNEAG